MFGGGPWHSRLSVDNRDHMKTYKFQLIHKGDFTEEEKFKRIRARSIGRAWKRLPNRNLFTLFSITKNARLKDD